MTNNKFVKYNNTIYKIVKYKNTIYNIFDNTHWIQMTNIFDLKQNRLVSPMCEYEKYAYEYSKANKEINDFWDNVSQTWNYNGQMFSNTGNLSFTHYKKCGNHLILDWCIYPYIKYHKFNDCKYYVVWYRGNLYWMVTWHYIPRCQLYKFEDINTPPKTFIKWTHIRHLKPVYNETLKRFV